MNIEQLKKKLVEQRKLTITQREICRRMGKSPQTVSNFENTQRPVSFTSIQHYANALGLEILFFIKGKE